LGAHSSEANEDELAKMAGKGADSQSEAGSGQIRNRHSCRDFLCPAGKITANGLVLPLQ
jgi:hypothetical protein